MANPTNPKLTNVPIRHTIDRFTEIHLEDGTVLNFKVAVASVGLIADKWDNEGNPLYAVKHGPGVSVVVHCPGDLKKSAHSDNQST